MSKQREAFEAWLKARGGSPMKRGGEYVESMARLWWGCWQASRAAALEEAAEICELARGQSLKAVEQHGAEEGYEACAAIGGAQQASKLRDAFIALKEQS